MAVIVCGKLPGEFKVNLEIAENIKEVIDIKNEYKNVFGSQITLWTKKISKAELQKAKKAALANLLNGLIKS